MASFSGFTLGVEEEFQIVSQETWALHAVPAEVLREGLKEFHDHLHREMHQSTVELVSDICQDIGDVEAHVRSSRKQLHELLGSHGLAPASAGTHPFTNWKSQHPTDSYRYREVLREFRQAARALTIYGLHVHVGIADRQVGLAVANASFAYLPLILALSANSPFWVGVDTGFKSFRADYFLQVPRTGLPHQFETLEEYDEFIETLVACKSIDNPKKTYWDVRLHPFFRP